MYKRLRVAWLKIKAKPVKEFADMDSMSLSFEGNADEQTMAKLLYMFLEANQGIREYVFSMFRFTPRKDDRRTGIDKRVQGEVESISGTSTSPKHVE